jgi:mutator protein MutT
MPISEYLGQLRAHIGHALVLSPGVAAIVRDDNGRPLAQRRGATAKWSLPGGTIDPGETPAEAVVREVREDTGLIVRATRLTAVLGGFPMRFSYPSGDQVEVVVNVIECEVIGGELFESVDDSELKYLDPSDYETLFPTLPEAVLAGTSLECFFQT